MKPEDFTKFFKQTKGEIPKQDPPETEEGKKQDVAEIPQKKKGESFVEQKKREAEEARKRAEELEAKYKELEAKYQETEQKASKLTELEEQLKAAKPLSEYEQILKERDELKGEAETIRTKYEEAKRKNDFLDYQGSEEFQRNYNEPVMQAWRSLAEVIGPDEDKQNLLARIANANEVSLTATADGRARAERERDTLIDELWEQLTGHQQYNFNALVNTVKERTRARHEALMNWEQNVVKDREAASERNRQISESIKKKWETGYQEAEEIIAPDLTIPDIIKSEVGEIDTTPDDIVAKAIISGNNTATTSDMTRLIRQGAAYGALKAKMTAYEKKIAELQGTIQDLRGSSTTGSMGAGDGPVQKTKEELEKEAAEELVGQFFGKKR